ncbi:MAG: TlpA family protein disulfide reductase [Lachnospiraceae bacterium]|nr:TlpA family protein disulfide reductase [Lachnospiraceae bacterium]
MKHRNLMVCFLGAALMLGLVAAGCGKKETPSESLETGETNGSQEAGLEEGREENQEQSESSEEEVRPGLGTFEAKTLDGETFTQEEIAKKDATLINFWTTSCGPCIEEMPEIAKLAADLPENVQIVTVCLDGVTSEETAKEVLQKAGFEGATLVSGNGGLAGLVSGIMYTPTTIVVDADGNMVGDAIIGGQKNLGETFVAAINEALKSAGKSEIVYEEE